MGLLATALGISATVCGVALLIIGLIERPVMTALADAEPTDVAPARTAAAATPVPLTRTVSPSPSGTVAPRATASPQATRARPTPTTSDASAAYAHAVEAGETLSAIAARYGVSLEDIVSLNDVPDPDLLYAGDSITLPSSARLAEQKAPETDTTAVPVELSLSPVPPGPDEMIRGRWIDVDISEQRLTAYQETTPVRTTLVSTGLPETPTPVGQFHIWIKLRFDDMAGEGYYIEDVPFVMYFHEGYGLHGVTWHGNFGYPMSHGCVNLPTTEAEWLYEWADVGTLVNIHE